MKRHRLSHPRNLVFLQGKALIDPVSCVMDVWCADKGDDQRRENGQHQYVLGDTSAAEPASPQSSESGSHPGLLVRAPRSQPALNGQFCDDSEQTSNLHSSPSAGYAAAELQHHCVETGTARRPEPLARDEDSVHEEPAASSSGWSSDEGGADRAGALGQMAESMLAALTSSRPGASIASTAAGAPQDRMQSLGRHLNITRPSKVHVSRPAAGQDVTGQLPGSDSNVVEVHWEPAVQLPAPQAADGGRREEVLAKAEPVPAGQVRDTARCFLWLSLSTQWLTALLCILGRQGMWQCVVGKMQPPGNHEGACSGQLPY